MQDTLEMKHTGHFMGLLFLLLLLSPPFGLWAQTPARLSSPIDCVIGEACWIVNYFDQLEGEGRQDYRCGPHSYDNHRGTDFAIPHLGSMERGVDVIAAAPGKILGVRDGMLDINVNELGRDKLQGKDCGNGVSIDHGNGLRTQYCHLKRGSVQVSEGQSVRRGTVLGQVGLSGNTVFPHVHLSVFIDGKQVDPFAPDFKGCSQGTLIGEPLRPGTLWTEKAAASFAYEPAVPYIAGFASERASAEKARGGAYNGIEITSAAPVLTFWGDTFNLRAGDRLKFTILGPDGRVLAENEETFDTPKARWFMFIGRRRPQGGWPIGQYTGHIQIFAGDTLFTERERKATLTITE